MCMPRFHFNITNGHTILDPHGRCLTDEKAARAEGKLVAEEWEEGKKVQITDGKGKEIEKVPTNKKY
jgi:hypothetical protein